MNPDSVSCAEDLDKIVLSFRPSMIIFLKPLDTFRRKLSVYLLKSGTQTLGHICQMVIGDPGDLQIGIAL